MTVAMEWTEVDRYGVPAITVLRPCDPDPADADRCVWEEGHHLDSRGRHWCPTGMVICRTHGGFGSITGPATCHRWGVAP